MCCFAAIAEIVHHIERNEGAKVHKGQCGCARLAQALLKAQNLLG
jgi:hypothetical protein